MCSAVYLIFSIISGLKAFFDCYQLMLDVSYSKLKSYKKCFLLGYLTGNFSGQLFKLFKISKWKCSKILYKRLEKLSYQKDVEVFIRITALQNFCMYTCCFLDNFMKTFLNLKISCYLKVSKNLLLLYSFLPETICLLLQLQYCRHALNYYLAPLLWTPCD